MVDELNSCATLSTDAELEAALSESFERPVVLLKHSEWCSVSERAIEAARGEIEEWAKRIGCRIVVVQNQRELCDSIARRLGIRHETPQILVIRNGRAVWDASHAGITESSVRRALEAALAGTLLPDQRDKP